MNRDKVRVSSLSDVAAWALFFFLIASIIVACCAVTWLVR